MQHRLAGYVHNIDDNAKVKLEIVTQGKAKATW
jgi:hypothetical protein